MASSAWRRYASWIKTIALVLAAWLVFRSTIADLNEVTGSSMQPTLLPGDWLAVNRLAYGLRLPYARGNLLNWHQPRRGDIVVLDDPMSGRRIVKRVVGLPGDRLEIRDGMLLVNGEVDDQGEFDKQESLAPLTVPEGNYFVLGDNRQRSLDSRAFGPVDQGRIVGRAGGVMLSFDSRNCSSPRWRRFFSRP